MAVEVQETAGRLSSDVTQALQPVIDRGDLSGIVTLTWKDGSIIQRGALGWRDIESRAPMQPDTLFRIASKTKPVTTVAALMLMEEGKFQLRDEITKWAPEFSHMRVLRDPNGPLASTEPAHRAITFEDLMTHRAGLAYGFTASGPIAKAYEEALGGPMASPKTADEWLGALASLPLLYQPGDRLFYSHATDVLGVLVGRIAGASFRDVLIEKVFAPLGMPDTAFWVPHDKRARMASLYRFSEEKDGLTPAQMPLADAPPAYCSGGGGLISTADDYLRFARMLLNYGEVDGVRLLKADTVRAMRTDHLTAAQRAIPFLGLQMWAGAGFGLGLSIIDDPAKNLLGVGSVGSFSWPGAFGTWWQADPVKNLIMIYMIQHSMPLGPDAGAQIAGGRGMAGRLALPAYQRVVHEALG